MNRNTVDNMEHAPFGTHFFLITPPVSMHRSKGVSNVILFLLITTRMTLKSVVIYRNYD